MAKTQPANYDELLNETYEPSEQQGFSDEEKQAWQEKQAENRETAHTILDTALNDISVDGGVFQSYLDKQSQFDRHSVRNALLIMAQSPDASKVGDKSFWKKLGFYIKKTEKDNPILIFEPGKAFLRDNNTVGQFFNAKEVYDIMQTTANVRQTPPPARDGTLLIKALIANRPANIITIDDGLPFNAQYQPESNEILARAGMGLDDMFRSLSKELAHAELAKTDENYSYEGADFKAKCVSYMLCKKNGIESGYDFKDAPDSLQHMEASEVLGELTSANEAAKNISTRMAKVFEQNKPQKEQPKER